jgi:kynurenine formamidase
VTLTTQEFDALYDEVAQWDDASDRGTLRYLTAERVVAAARLVRSGLSVSLSLPMATDFRPDCPTPAEHRMTSLGGDDDIVVQFVKDYIGTDFHNEGHTHLDALCHVSYRGKFYGGVPDTSATEDGASVGDIAHLSSGIVGRGVLLDIPRLRGVPWLEPGDQVLPGELTAALKAQSVGLQPGDILLVRTGHTRRLAELGPWDTTKAKAGLHPTVVEILTDHQVTALGCDTNSDAAPSPVNEVSFPVHVLTVNAMGLFLLDYLQLDDLSEACERLGRWEFLCVVAPLRVPGGTGSPVNPIAVL